MQPFTRANVVRRLTELSWLAFLWAIGDTVYVYLFTSGERTFRLESSAYILVAVLFPLLWWRGRDNRQSETLTRSDAVTLCLVAFALWVTALVPYVRLPFLSDDYVFLASFREAKDVLNNGQLFRPLFGAVFFALSRVGGGSPSAFHAASWLLHLSATVCVFVLARRIFRRADAAAICAWIFLLNPLQLEPTLWASGLQELLWTVLLLSALVVYTGSQVLSVPRLTATLALVASALLSKETAIASVFLLPGADWLLFRWARGRWLTAAYVALGVLAAGYFWIRAQFAIIERSFLVMPDKFFVQKFLSTPYKCFIQPWNVATAHIPAVVLCATAALALIVLFRAVLRGAGPGALAGPVVIVFSTLPVYNFFFVGADLRSSRYLYFAAFGWALLVTHMMMTLLARRWSMIAASAGMIVFSAIFLHINLPPWRTAGDIVNSIAAAIRQGQPPEASVAEWRARYGDGIEVKDGIPAVYRGVYVLLNGYPELRAAVSSSKP